MDLIFSLFDTYDEILAVDKDFCILSNDSNMNNPSLRGKNPSYSYPDLCMIYV